MNPLTYLKDTWAELKQVRWPTPESTLKMTGLVVVISLFVAAYVGSLDFLLTNLLTVIIK